MRASARRGRRKVRVVDASVARGGDLVASDLYRTGVADVGDHDLLTVAADPHRLPGEPVGTEYCAWSNQINRVFSAIVRVTPNAAVNGAAGSRCNRRLLGEHLHWRAASDPVRPRVDRLGVHAGVRAQGLGIVVPR